MTRQRLVLLLVAAVVVIAGAFYLTNQRNPPRQTRDVDLLPTLGSDLGSVTATVIRKGGIASAVTLHKSGAEWTVAERGEYPADVAKLRKLLSALRDAKIVEEKTSDPSRYAVIGVEDLSQPGSTGTEITVVAAGGKHAVIVGKAAGEGNYVRRAGEPRSYTVEPAIAAETEPHFWIDSRLLDVPAALIQSIEVKPAAGAAYAVHRLDVTDNAYRLDGVPAGRKPLDGHALAPAPTLLASLAAEDVSPVADLDFSRSSRAVVTLTDGGILTLTGTVLADKHWIQVNSSKDSALTAKTQGRAFEVAGYRYDAIFKSLDQLLLPKEPSAKVGRTAPVTPPPP